ncbi:hypothetical protein G7Y89_g7790 [Cudoniella acicularis]|uniref:TLC domain-containing protein n=1 Tax=Cudoniella acicularis TaxID=354080 RepID=A0A8H4RJU1_9HELO|nr:hypothetical protein G7Y89_g7790 [Cudoniella acicularis]
MDMILDARDELILNTTTKSFVAQADNRGPHITHLSNGAISRLAPFSALIITIIFVIYFFIRFYLLEKYLLKKIYGEVYTSMNEITRRGFVNHHIAGTTKLAILIFAAYPFIDVAFGSSTLTSPYAGSTLVTQGDMLIVAAQALMAMYVFELFYRPKISPVSAGHHIGTIMIGQSAIAISLNWIKESDATIEFILCAFDIVSEFLPHISIILYRVYPTSHDFLRKLFRISALTTLTGTVAETIVTMWLFGSLWPKWTLAFKVVTPMLHVLFMSCQMWGSWNFYKMYKRQERLLAISEGRLDDVEKLPKDTNELNEPKNSNQAQVSGTEVYPEESRVDSTDSAPSYRSS